MKVWIDTYVPEGADFADGGWEPMLMDIPACLSERAIANFINRILSDTEVTAFRWNGKHRVVL